MSGVPQGYILRHTVLNHTNTTVAHMTQGYKIILDYMTAILQIRKLFNFVIPRASWLILIYRVRVDSRGLEVNAADQIS